ncbi:MAG: sulfurtransferase complex subunit TusC [Candidatus Schmidhempelia sp.]|nr:sulfurtransferase complex subunit TusC [Candidatus Schmidhempelia sp.]
MKKVAIILSQAPHGNAKGREALDAALALSAYNQVSLFFMGDGVFHLLKNQQPERILMRNYIATFGLLELYDIEYCYALSQDIACRQITDTNINVKLIDDFTWRELLNQQDAIIQF